MLLGKRARSWKSDPHGRRFGVEIECGLPRGTGQAEDLFSVDWEGHRDGEEEGWWVDSDGSGVEVKTPILRGEKGFEKVRWAMDLLKAEGGYVTNADGLHIHHDAPEFVSNPNLCLQLVNSWRNNEPVIHQFVAPRRRQSSACPSWSQGYFEYLERWARGESSVLSASRNDLNLASLRSHGTIEVRLHEGTLDADVAIAWIMFGQRFIHEVLQNVDPLANAETDESFMAQIKLSDEAKAILAAKKNKDHVTDGSRYDDSRRYRSINY